MDEELKVSAKAVALFIVGGPSKKETVARNLRKPQSAEAKAISHYYAKARDIIRLYHEQGNDKKFVAKQMRILESELLQAAGPWAHAKLKHNIRCINEYLQRFGDHVMVILPRPRIAYLRDRVRVSASPDLAIESNGEIVLVRLGTSKTKEDPEIVRIILRITFEAARERFRKIVPKNILYLDLTGNGHQFGTSDDAGLMTTIDRACDQLAHMCLP